MGTTGYADRIQVTACLKRLEDIEKQLASLSLSGLSGPELLKVAARRERVLRMTAAFDQKVLAALKCTAAPTELGATTMAGVLTGALQIGRTEAHRRLRNADRLAPRTTLTGQPVPPLWPTVAAAQARGSLGSEHVAVIDRFFKNLPDTVGAPEWAAAEETLAREAARFGPEEFSRLAEHLLVVLHPDGELNERDTVRRRNFTMGRQQADGLTEIRGHIDAESASYFELIMARFAARGMCNPDAEAADATGCGPCVQGTPTEAQVAADTRTVGQRQHDALKMAARMVLSSKKLGTLNGLPATVVISTTLQDLHDATHSHRAGTPGTQLGRALAATAGRTRLTMADVLRISAHSYHYLVVFDDASGRALHLGRTKRLASPDQRLVLLNKYRGCTFPGCTAPGLRTQMHHAVADWADGGQTEIDDLTLA